jgi:hypothetical protein
MSTTLPQHERPADAPQRPPRRRRALRWIVIGGIAVLGLLLWTGASLGLAAGPLRTGRASLEDARRAILAGDLSLARERFARADESFDHAGRSAGLGPGFLPLVGNTNDAVVAVANAGGHLAAAGTLLVDGLGDVDGGLDALAPVHGALPLDTYQGLAASLAAASHEADAAATAAADAPDGFLLDPVAQGRWDAEAGSAELAADLRNAQALVDGLPGFAGADGPRRYLVLSANPAELRGTGGLWGAYATLTFRDGKPTLSDTTPTNRLPLLNPGEIDGLDPAYHENYDRFGGAGSWKNMNFTPDFPWAARAALGNLAAGGRPPVDGVISADPYALEAMLRVTGPLEVPAANKVISASNVIRYTMNEAYGEYSVVDERKDILGEIASAVLSRFLEMEGHGLARIRAMGDAISGGHLSIYSTDPSFQAALEASGAAGSFAAPADGDLVGVSVVNGSGSKVDYYATRSIDLAVALGGNAEALGEMTVTIGNDAPTHGQPRYVIGPYVDSLSAGDQLPFISTWCRQTCDLIQARRDGEEHLVVTGAENGLTFFRDYRPIASGDEGSFDVRWHSQGVWSGDPWNGRYRLEVPSQATVEPTRATVRITAPPGASIVWTSVPMEVDGSSASWSGTLDHDLVFEVRFRASFATRWWRSLTG